MGTPFEVVYDRALATIKDYKLDSLAQSDYTAFTMYLQGILEWAIPEFTGCLNDLSYDPETQSFSGALTNKEISILAKLMVAGWFTGQVQDVTQFELHLTNREFHHYAESQNLREKSEYLDRLREKYSQDIMNYQLANMSKIFHLT